MSIPTLAYRGFALLPLLQPVAQIATRLMIGIAFVQTGLGKWGNFERTVGFFQGLGIPAPSVNAAFVATVELLGGACLVAGLGTRVAALLLSATMIVAIATAHGEQLGTALASFTFGQGGVTDVVPLVYLVFLAWLIGSGGGPLAADRWLARKLGAAGTAGPAGGVA